MIDHGTRRGYQQHKAIGSIPCEACHDANNAYMREYERARYTPERRRAKYEAAKARGYYARCLDCFEGVTHLVHDWEC